MRNTKNQDAVINQIRAYRERELPPFGYSVNAAVAEFEKLHRELMQTRSCEPLRLGVRMARGKNKSPDKTQAEAGMQSNSP